MKRYIGVDLHTNSFTFCIRQENGEESIGTLTVQGNGMEEFQKLLLPTDELAVEGTGNSAWFIRKIEQDVARTVIIAPWQFEVIRRSVKKTDKHDARAIALFLSKDMLPTARLKQEYHEQLRSLIATRDQLMKLRVSLIGKVHGLFVRHGHKVKREVLTSQVGFARETQKVTWSALEQAELNVISAQLISLHNSIKQLEKDIEAYAQTLPDYDNILSIKGIGPLSAAVILTHIRDIQDFKNPGKLAAYFGIVPSVSQSNDSQRNGNITKRGNKLARSTLVQCSLVAKRYSSYFHEFYERIKAKRGAGKAIIATARKLLNTIFHTLKNGWVFTDFPSFTKLSA